MSDVTSTHDDEVGFFHQPQAPDLFCVATAVGSIDTPNRVEPDVSFTAKFFSDKIELDGKDVEFWTFEADNGDHLFPAPLRRVRAGQVFHHTIKPSKHVHTLHHHGMEPGPHDDGVGHMSFEVSGSYTYQIRPMDPGTYFYHCHVNTPLHFEMGMYGGFIVDPPSGPGTVYGDEASRYDVEAFWAFGGWDVRKHDLNQAAGFDGQDVGLNVWEPQYLHINGAFGDAATTSRRVTIDAQTGQTVCLRLLNAGYSVARVTFGGLEAELIGSDGRAFPASFKVDQWLTSGAERYEALLRPTRPGTYPITVEFFHYITGKSLGVVTGNLVVTGPDVTPPPPVLPHVETPAGPVVVAPPPVAEPGLGVTRSTAPQTAEPVSTPAPEAPANEPAAYHPATTPTAPTRPAPATAKKPARKPVVKVKAKTKREHKTEREAPVSRRKQRLAKKRAAARRRAAAKRKAAKKR
jgi:FtsP/CotA-like multicopper oxidase with cupredoxin domain